MFRFLRRHDRQPAETPVEEQDPAVRAEAFWRTWDEELLPEVTSALGDGEVNRVDHPLAKAVENLHPRLTVSIERGETALYALVVSSQADPELRAITDAWMAAAPQPDQVWEYHDAIPPVPDPTQVTVNLHGGKYSLADVRVATQIEDGLIDVAVHHPGFADLGEAERRALTFLPLEATLGERMAADRVGRVETAELLPQGAVGLLEFRERVRALDAAPSGSTDGPVDQGTGLPGEVS